MREGLIRARAITDAYAKRLRTAPPDMLPVKGAERNGAIYALAELSAQLGQLAEEAEERQQSRCVS